jgi:uncharacterized protein YcbX
MDTARVVGLTYYPVKSCAGVDVGEAEVTRAGLAHDRSFMVVSEEGVFRTQRRDPKLALVSPEPTGDGRHLTLRAPDHGEVSLAVEPDGVRRAVDLFGKPYEGIDQGDDVAAWLTDWLGSPSRLVRVPPDHARVTDGCTPGTCGYADSGAVLVVSEKGAPALPMTRFRPNIVIDGWPDPHTEDRAHRLALGAASLAYAKPATRCAVVLVDQATARRSGPEPLRTLADYRRLPSGATGFGVKFSVVATGKVTVGDEVLVGEWGEAEC